MSEGSEGASPQWGDSQPIWWKKTTTWLNTFRKACTLKTGMGGQFCLWTGTPCSYNGCPARVFEEVEMREPSYFLAMPPSGLTATIQEQREQILEQGRQIVHLQMRINQMKISGKCSLKARFEVRPSEANLSATH